MSAQIRYAYSKDQRSMCSLIRGDVANLGVVQNGNIDEGVGDDLVIAPHFFTHPICLVSIPIPHSPPMVPVSIQTEQIDDDAFVAALTGSHEQSAVDPVVALVSGFQQGVGAHVVAVVRHVLAPGNCCDHLGRAMAKAIVADLDSRTVIGFHRVAGVQLGGAVPEDGLPVGTKVQDRPVDLRAADRTADDRDDPAMTSPSGAHFADRTKLHFEAEGEFK